MNAPADAAGRSPWKRVWPVVKWSLFAIVVAFVARRAWLLWSADRAAFAALELRPGWLVPAVLAYLAGWLPSIWFWRLMLARLGNPAGAGDATRAYFCGHLGKYIPGKALVLVIRAALLRDRGVRPAAAALTAAYETLAMMAVGAALGVALLPSVVSVSIWDAASGPFALPWEQPWFRRLWTTRGALAVTILLVACALLPLLARLATWAAAKMVPHELEGNGGVPRRPIDARLFALGMLVLIAAWWIHGLSLGCVIAAVSGEPFDLARWPAWTAAVSLATSLGFAAIFAPGGAGVREWVLIEVLRVQPGITPQAAVAAALLLRLVWLAAEIAMAAGLYWGMRPASAGAVEGRGTRVGGRSS